MDGTPGLETLRTTLVGSLVGFVVFEGLVTRLTTFLTGWPSLFSTSLTSVSLFSSLALGDVSCGMMSTLVSTTLSSFSLSSSLASSLRLL